MISFSRDAGIDLSEPEGEAAPSKALPGKPSSRAIEAHLARLGLRAHGLDIYFEAASGVLAVGGCALNQDVRERIVLCCGNVRGVGAVDDRMTVVMPSELSRWRFVQPGDTLARIAQDLYRDAGRAPHLRAANQPLLGDNPDPPAGWLLRVPA